MIDKLGLAYLRTRQAQTSIGDAPCNLYTSVVLTIQGRYCTTDVAEVAEGCPVLVGYLPLEGLDFIVDPKPQRLVPIEEAGGPHLLDLF